MISPEITAKLLSSQRNEITEHFIYKKLARSTKDQHNREILLHISKDELRHYDFWKQATGKDVKPNMSKVWFYYLVSRIFGLTFSIKLMERGEDIARTVYRELSDSIPEALEIAEEEDRHEAELIDMIEEERLEYVGAMILGLNDALVELSGSLAGFTLALQDPKLVAMVGLITGIAASLSMGSTSYLASKAEKTSGSPVKSGLYTGIAYIFTVAVLILPYLLLSNVLIALAVMICNVIIVILVFNFYISVAQNLSFTKRFSEMAILSIGIAAVSFGIGFLMRQVFGIDI
ncbi:MAG: VIT1/CCC1 transporter family protein [Dehalococcoidales bacterium]|nr:VIT1/CCC1 transporter family protein [Dehalococcoidales bacterium]